MRGGREVVFDGFSQGREVVEWHDGIHVMFHVVLHVPIEKSYKSTARVGAAAQTEIRSVRSHANMLGHADEHRETVTIGRRQIHDEDEDPVAGRDEYGGQEQMAEQDHPRPVFMAPAKDGVRLGQDFFHPGFAPVENAQPFEISGGISPKGLQSIPYRPRVWNRSKLPEPETKAGEV